MLLEFPRLAKEARRGAFLVRSTMEFWRLPVHSGSGQNSFGSRHIAEVDYVSYVGEGDLAGFKDDHSVAAALQKLF